MPLASVVATKTMRSEQRVDVQAPAESRADAGDDAVARVAPQRRAAPARRRRVELPPCRASSRHAHAARQAARKQDGSHRAERDGSHGAEAQLERAGAVEQQHDAEHDEHEARRRATCRARSALSRSTHRCSRSASRRRSLRSSCRRRCRSAGRRAASELVRSSSWRTSRKPRPTSPSTTSRGVPAGARRSSLQSTSMPPPSRSKIDDAAHADLRRAGDADVVGHEHERVAGADADLQRDDRPRAARRRAGRRRARRRRGGRRP